MAGDGAYVRIYLNLALSGEYSEEFLGIWQFVLGVCTGDNPIRLEEEDRNQRRA